MVIRYKEFCRKCGGNEFNIEWQDLIEGSACPVGNEHLEWACTTCGYTWDTPTKDNEEADDETKE